MNEVKLALQFFADILYIKGILYFSEYEAIGEVKHPSDLDDIIDRMLTDDFSPYKRGEAYVTRNRTEE